MRNDRLPQENAESERTPGDHGDPPFMDYTPLVILQQRLNALESNYGEDQDSNYDQIVEPRIARVAPMSPTPESMRGRLPPISYRATATIDISALHLPNPTAASFSNAAAATAAPAHVATAPSAVRVAAHSAAHTTPSSYTATYAAPPLNYNTTVPSVYCVASTSGNGYYGAASASNSDADSAAATGVDAVSGGGHDYVTIPPFVRRALYSQDAAAAAVAIRRPAPDEGDEHVMDEEGTVPRKTAKRSSEHVTVVGGDGAVGGNVGGVGGNVGGVGGYVGFVPGNGSGGGYVSGYGSGYGGGYGGGNGSGNGSGVVGNGSDVGGNGIDETMDCEE